MDSIFIETADEPKTRAKKSVSKKEKSNEEYLRVCERMAELRARRKNPELAKAAKQTNPDKPKSEPKPKPEPKIKEVIKYVDRPVEVEKVVEKVVEKPARDLFDTIGEADSIKSELKEVKELLAEMKARKLEKQKLKEAAAPSPAPSPAPSKPEPELSKPEPVKPRIIYPPLFRPF